MSRHPEADAAFDAFEDAYAEVLDDRRKRAEVLMLVEIQKRIVAAYAKEAKRAEKHLVVAMRRAERTRRRLEGATRVLERCLRLAGGGR